MFKWRNLVWAQNFRIWRVYMHAKLIVIQLIKKKAIISEMK